MKRPLFLLGLLLLASACSAGSEGATRNDESELQSVGLAFGQRGDPALDGSLTAGGSVRVVYDARRLPQCRGALSGGKPAWTIRGFSSINGAPAEAFNAAAPQTIRLPEAGDLAVWFQVTNRWGCSEYDSRGGENYHFRIGGQTPPEPTLVFKTTGVVDSNGVLRAGGKARVRYEQDRLPNCRGTMMGMTQWAITGYASLNGGAARSFETGRDSGGGDRTPIDAEIDLPESGDLAVWFQVTSRWGCTDYDSAGGANYHFTVR